MNVDTNVLSELRRPKPEPKVLEFVGGRPLDLLFVSAVTLAEIRFGIELVADADRRAELNDWLTHKVRPMFEQRVLAVSEDVLFKQRLPVEDGRKRRPTIFASRSDDRRVRVTSRLDRRHPRRERHPESARPCVQSLAGRRADKRRVSGFFLRLISATKIACKFKRTFCRSICLDFSQHLLPSRRRWAACNGWMTPLKQYPGS